MDTGDKVNESVGKVFDGFKGMSDPKNWTAGKICALIGSVVILTLFITLTIYCGVYAYNNPDPNNAWIIKGVDSPSLSKATAMSKASTEGVTVPEGYPIDMHKIFVAWATWGFWQNLVLIIIFCASGVITFLVPSIFPIVASLTALGWFIGTFLWLVFGAIWRFSFGGSTASGDKLLRDESVSAADWKISLQAASDKDGYQINTGKFMSTIFGLIGGVVMLVLLACAVAGVLMCFCGWDKDSINKYNMMPQDDKDADKGEQNEPIESDHYEEQNDQLGLNDRKPAAKAY